MSSSSTPSVSEIHIRESVTDSRLKKKPVPQASKISVPFSYSPSDDGTDENLLILLHGLGDTHTPFAGLGKSLKLPQTATLALRAPEQVPFLYEQAFQWYPSFTDLGETITRPNPTSVLALLTKIVDYLTSECTWPAERIHLFGFAQGGSVAVEFGLRRTEEQALGSIVSVSGPLFSYPTLSTKSQTPVFVFHRPRKSGDDDEESEALPKDAIVAFKRGYESVLEASLVGAGMPGSKKEWTPIMKFWSEKLGTRRMDGLYEIMSGTASVA